MPIHNLSFYNLVNPASRNHCPAGGIIFGFIGGITAKQGREPILVVGLVTSVMAYFLMLLNLPPASPIRETEPGETGFITPSTGIVLFTGGLLGFSDSCFMTQVS